MYIQEKISTRRPHDHLIENILENENYIDDDNDDEYEYFDGNFNIYVYITNNFKDIIDYLSNYEYNLYLKTIRENDKNKLEKKIALFKNIHQELIESYWSPYGKGFRDLNEKYNLK